MALSGPTHAEEVAIDLPTTIVSASKDMEAARFVQTVFTLSLIHICSGGPPQTALRQPPSARRS